MVEIDDMKNDQLNSFKDYLKKKSDLFQLAEKLPSSIVERENTLPDLDEWRNLNEREK